jgi:DNA repair exonuclease SbcCD ATPase subunit
MAVGQTIHVPLADLTRASAHATLSRIRRQYADVMGRDLLPSWRLEIPAEPGDFWAITYLGLRDGGRAPQQRLTPEQRRANKREYTRRMRRERADRLFSQLLQHSREDERLRGDVEPGYEPVTDDMVAEANELRKADDSRREKARQRMAEKRAKERAEREHNAQPRQRPQPGLDDVQALLDQIAVSAEFYETRLEQVEGHLAVARERLQNATPTHLLSTTQLKRIAQDPEGTKSRYDRAQAKVNELRRKRDRYEAKLDALEAERERIKELRQRLQEA